MNRKSRHHSPAQWFLVGLLLLVVTGCGKIKNSNPEIGKKRGWLFSNYYIVNTAEDSPDRTTEVSKRPKEAARVNKTEFAGLSLRLLVWTNVIPNSVLNSFTQRFGAKIIVSYYASNQELYDRVTRGEHYDVIMPSQHIVGRFLHDNKLVKLDHANLPNLKHVDARFRDKIYDPGNLHSIPYLWYTTGIAFNFSRLEMIPEHWRDLLDPAPDMVPVLKNRVALLDEPRRLFGSVLIHLGYSPNTENTNELSAAARFLQTQQEALHFRYESINLGHLLANEEILMAQAYSYEVAKAIMRNPKIHFTLPEDGALISVDNWAMLKPVNSRQKPLGEAFINFMLEPVAAASVVDQSFHASTLSSAKAFIRHGIKISPAYQYPEDINKTFQVLFTPESATFRDFLWLKIQGKSIFQIPPAP